MTPKIRYLSASRPNSSDPRNPQPVEGHPHWLTLLDLGPIQPRQA
jgi:hypothetical protein